MSAATRTKSKGNIIRSEGNPDGSIRHALATYTPHLVEGQVQGLFVPVSDVTPLKLHEQNRRDLLHELAQSVNSLRY